MGQPEYAFDKTFCSAALLRALAEEYGTPLLVYDRETWLGRVKLLKEAFSWAPGFRQFFPVKAAANPAPAPAAKSCLRSPANTCPHLEMIFPT